MKSDASHTKQYFIAAGDLTNPAMYLFHREEIKAKPCISSKRSFAYHPQFIAVYHHCESDTTCGWWYAPSVMIYTLTCDDMPLLPQWIKKEVFDFNEIAQTRWNPLFVRMKSVHPASSRISSPTGISFAAGEFVDFLKSRDYNKLRRWDYECFVHRQ